MNINLAAFLKASRLTGKKANQSRKLKPCLIKELRTHQKGGHETRVQKGHETRVQKNHETSALAGRHEEDVLVDEEGPLIGHQKGAPPKKRIFWTASPLPEQLVP